MDSMIEEHVEALIAHLQAQLNEQEDAETAIATYKTVNWIIDQLEAVKQAALALAQADMEQRGRDALKTPFGSAGWTKPEVKQLDEAAWIKALGADSALWRIQREFDAAQATLRQAQEPYRALPDPRFFIR
jgi:hypothetical protein